LLHAEGVSNGTERRQQKPYTSHTFEQKVCKQVAHLALRVLTAIDRPLSEEPTLSTARQWYFQAALFSENRLLQARRTHLPLDRW
jgi:hypothetical protein